MRQTDRFRIWLLTAALTVSIAWPVRNLWAQSQEFINGSNAMQFAALGGRIDKIENMINAVLVAMVINFVAQLIQLKRAPTARKVPK